MISTMFSSSFFLTILPMDHKLLGVKNRSLLKAELVISILYILYLVKISIEHLFYMPHYVQFSCQMRLIEQTVSLSVFPLQLLPYMTPPKRRQNLNLSCRIFTHIKGRAMNFQVCLHSTSLHATFKDSNMLSKHQPLQAVLLIPSIIQKKYHTGSKRCTCKSWDSCQ